MQILFRSYEKCTGRRKRRRKEEEREDRRREIERKREKKTERTQHIIAGRHLLSLSERDKVN